MEKKWHILEPDAETVNKLHARLHCHPITATILVNRKLTSAQEASRFISCPLSAVRTPFSLKDMDVAVQRIYRAIIENENILIFGDYDVDGITATAVLLNFLGEIGAKVSAYIPHRIKEGYSLQTHHIRDFALPNRIQLIITADCGSGSHDAVIAACDSGIDVIVTDHHMISEKIPPAVAVLNPKRHDCQSGMEMMAGVGMAFSLVVGLRKYLRDHKYWKDRLEPNLKNLCDLVALGTIADMVPLVEENRIYSKVGLDLINSAIRPGLSALRKVAGIANRPTDAEDIAFRLAPRLNAAGRMDHASIALKLLTTTNNATAQQLAESLNGLNDRRQKQEHLILDDILPDFEHHPDHLKKKALVCWHPEWHQGVLGIVASRIMEKYFRPVVLIAVKEEFGKGSARSIPGLNLFKALHACQHCLEDFGGHSMAAGLTIRTQNLAEFQNTFEKTVAKMTRSDDSIPQLNIDAEIKFADITEILIDEIEALSPFGTANPEPVFMTRNVKVVSSKIVGRNHRKMLLAQDADSRSKPVHAIRFNADGRMQTETAFSRIAFRMRWNRWNANKTIQLIIEDAY
ncbi:MAG: single-stranded-DNA-specific exonuclease RecJ [Desulfobacterales bacterium]|jgi:single-stranded-DNA-specific exonuclease